MFGLFIDLVVIVVLGWLKKEGCVLYDVVFCLANTWYDISASRMNEM